MKKRNLIICGALCVCLVFAGVMALFTDTDTETNTFTIGNCDIDLTEPAWSEDNAKNLSPNAVIAKDPQVTNDSTTNACYTYLEVSIPKDSTGELFAMLNKDGNAGVNDGWVLVESDTSGEASNTYVYAYASSLKSGGMTSLATSATTAKPLFSSVKVADRASFGDASYDIVVNAYGIQTSDLSSDTAAGIWALVEGELD